MAIQLKNLLFNAESSGEIIITHPDGTTSTKPFNQRNFGYGAGGGQFGFDSQPPFIITDLPPVGSESTGYVIEDPSTLDVVDDLSNNFVRGGAVTLGKRAFNDVERLGKLLFSPSGLTWSAAQLALARTNPIGPIPESDPEAAADPDRSELVQAIQSGVKKVKNKFPRNQVTLPLNLTLSAGVSAAGGRFRKDGLLDTDFENGYNYDPARGGDKYENITVSNAKVISENALESNKNFNKLLNIYGKHILSDDLEPSMESIKVDSKKRKDFANNYLLEYGGGAHSLFGVGRTAIKKYRSNPYDTSEAQGYTPIFNSKLFELRQGPNLKGGDIAIDSDGNPIPGADLHPDYRTIENNLHQSKPIPKNRTRIGLYNLGDPGKYSELRTARFKNTGDITDYNITLDTSVDKISAATLFKRENIKELGPEYKDYIKFRIAVVDTNNPLNDTVIVFRALLDNISDSFSGDWNSYKYNGRAEEFYTYSGFSRAINFGFKIHTQTRKEQQPLWNKLNYLVAQTAPEYKNRRMRGVFSRLTIGDWMHEIPGFFRSVDLSWNVAYPWEIKNDPEGLDNDVNQYPHILDVSCDFQPIHNFAPTNSPTTPFILPDKSLLPKQEEPKVAPDELGAQRIDQLSINDDIPNEIEIEDIEPEEELFA